jgi:hypothetical protein
MNSDNKVTRQTTSKGRKTANSSLIIPKNNVAIDKSKKKKKTISKSFKR